MIQITLLFTTSLLVHDHKVISLQFKNTNNSWNLSRIIKEKDKMMMKIFTLELVTCKAFITIIWLGIEVPIIANINMKKMFLHQPEVEFQAYMVLMANK